MARCARAATGAEGEHPSSGPAGLSRAAHHPAVPVPAVKVAARTGLTKQGGRVCCANTGAVSVRRITATDNYSDFIVKTLLDDIGVHYV